VRRAFRRCPPEFWPECRPEHRAGVFRCRSFLGVRQQGIAAFLLPGGKIDRPGCHHPQQKTDCGELRADLQSRIYEFRVLDIAARGGFEIFRLDARHLEYVVRRGGNRIGAVAYFLGVMADMGDLR
jgi:hypothetical protein